MSIFSKNLRRLNKNIVEFKYRHHAHEKRFKWNWREKQFNRIALVSYLINKCGGWNCSYLEIGCASNELFNSVAVQNKVGVDPAKGGTHRMTSDEFFASNDKIFDVIFIDGLHEYQQVRRDAVNALRCVSGQGWIAFHDFLPSNWQEQHFPRIRQEGAWTGDCWKLSVELCKAEGVEFRIINIDRGVGLLKKLSDFRAIPDMRNELAEAQFNRFAQEVENFPIVDFDDAIRLIDAA